MGKNLPTSASETVRVVLTETDNATDRVDIIQLGGLSMKHLLDTREPNPAKKPSENPSTSPDYMAQVKSPKTAPSTC